MKSQVLIGLAVLALGGVGQAALAAPAKKPAAPTGNAANGLTLYKQRCAVCHGTSEKPGAIGPSLMGVYGRKAGTSPGYKYSDGLAANGKVWASDTLDPWLKDPRDVVPTTKMVLTTPSMTDRQDVIAFLYTYKAPLN